MGQAERRRVRGEPATRTGLTPLVMHPLHVVSSPRMRSSSILLVAIVVARLAPTARAAAQDSSDVPAITLTDVLRAAQRDPPRVIVAYAELVRAQAERGYAKGGWYPSLVGQASVGYTYDNRLVLPGVPRIDSQSIESRAELNLDWSALNVARGARIDAAEATERAKGFDVETTRAQASVLAAELYLRAGAAIELVEDAKLSVERRTHQYEAAGELVKAGTRSPVDVQRAKIEVLSADYGLSLRRTDALAAFAALAAAIGRPANQLVRPAANSAAFPAVAASSARAKELAEKNRPELRGAGANITALRYAHDADIGERWPTLGVTASGSISYLDVRRGVGIDGDQYTAAGAIYLRWNGFDPAVWGRGSVSDAAVNIADRERSAMLHSIGAQAVAAYYALERAKTEHQRAVAVLEAAQVTREAQNGRYTAGVGSLLELLDAEDLEQQARQARIEAERDESIASAQLLSACGMLGR
jgi:outer membrane protein